MNYIEKMLAEQCPKGVEWMKLREVAVYEQPSKYLVGSTDYKDTFRTPVLTAGKTFILGYTDEETGIYPASESPVIIFDDFTASNKWVDFDFKVKSSAIKIIKSRDEQKVLLRFIYLWLNTIPFKVIHSNHQRQWINNFCKKDFPLPPLPIQREIARVLDKFVGLIELLKEELRLRHKQYGYYRDKLLTFPAKA